jgi:hypothetical protein
MLFSKKNKLTLILKWVIPYNLYVNLSRIFKKISRSKIVDYNHNFFEKINKNKNKIYIIGTGPSLKKVDLLFLKRADMFVCNEFNQHKKFIYLARNNNLTYFIGDNFKSFKDINDKFVGNWDSTIELFFRGRVSKNYTSVISLDIADQVKKKYQEAKVLGFNTSVIKEQIKKEFVKKGLSIDEKLIDEANNIRHTPHLMILVALAMGYKEIFLLGLDHSYVRDRFEGLLTQPHFYEEFDKTNEATRDMSSRDLTELFLDSHLTFKLYKSQNELARLLGVRIIDFTENGCLDMFEKRKLLSHDLGRNN